MDMLRVSHVSKSFGSHVVLDDLNFAVKEHTIYGFIGQNGAGKTTTMKMILGLLKIDQGEIEVNGQKSLMVKIKLISLLVIYQMFLNFMDI